MYGEITVSEFIPAVEQALKELGGVYSPVIDQCRFTGGTQEFLDALKVALGDKWSIGSAGGANSAKLAAARPRMVRHIIFELIRIDAKTYGIKIDPSGP